MKSFFKIFLAALLAILVFTILVFFFFMGMAGSAVSKNMPLLAEKSVLQIDLRTHFEEQSKSNIQSIIKSREVLEQPGLYDVIRLINIAKTDDKIKGIYLVANTNPNGFASSEELRNALADFKASKKFIIACGDVMTQKAYYVANIADKIYVSPKGYFEWFGMSANYMFLKGTLDKLDIKPQIFYAGKFKSATEPLRINKMSDASKLQTTVWLNDLYNDFLVKAAEVRKIDTATLHGLANKGTIQTPQDAFNSKLIDGAKYDDEIKDEIKKNLSLVSTDKINFISIEKYALLHKKFDNLGDKIALIYAYGNIIDGKSEQGSIGSATYIDLIRKARLDNSIKAIVVRVNSGGGSALASENIWREMVLAKKAKPLMVSFGDVAASGGYYMSCAADSIFAMPTTITGSIGVFGIIPDMSAFFKNKLGVTFDGVQTGPLANVGSPEHPMSEQEKKFFERSIENIYAQFKQRVGDGRKKDTSYVETIAQGRVWAGKKAKDIGLVDVYGGLQKAIEAAATKAKLKEYHVVEYPQYGGFLEKLFGLKVEDDASIRIKKELGEEYYNVYKQLKEVKEMSGSVQARLPFEFSIR
jgi:protease IV